MWSTDLERDPNRLSPDERYRRDPHFRVLVDVLEHHIREANYTPTELREAALLACIHYESTRPSRFVIPAPACLCSAALISERCPIHRGTR
jgi:hypothetical protein